MRAKYGNREYNTKKLTTCNQIPGLMKKYTMVSTYPYVHKWN